MGYIHTFYRYYTCNRYTLLQIQNAAHKNSHACTTARGYCLISSPGHQLGPRLSRKHAKRGHYYKVSTNTRGLSSLVHNPLSNIVAVIIALSLWAKHLLWLIRTNLLLNSLTSTRTKTFNSSECPIRRARSVKYELIISYPRT